MTKVRKRSFWKTQDVGLYVYYTLLKCIQRVGTNFGQMQFTCHRRTLTAAIKRILPM